MKTRVSIGGAVTVAGLLVCMGPATWARRASHASSRSPDAAFIKEAAQGGVAEVKLGRLALEKAVDGDVRTFAQRMVDDHSKANDELKQLTGSKGITLPSSIGSKNQKTHNNLARLSGASFDRAYMRDMVKDHEHDVAAFQRESQSGRDSSVKSWAGNTLPTLEEHLRMARETAGKVGVAAGGSAHRGRGSAATRM